MATHVRSAGHSDRRCPAGRGVLDELRPSRPGPGDAPKDGDALRPTRGGPTRSVRKRGGKYAVRLAVAACLGWFVCSVGHAEPRTAADAAEAVRGWLKMDASPLGTPLGHHVKSTETFTDNEGESLYFVVYLQPSGFVVVPADDLVEPVIAFAASGKYNPSPENALGALVSSDVPRRVLSARRTAGFSAVVRALSKSQGQAPSARAKWDGLCMSALPGPLAALGMPTISDERVSPLTQSRWSQRTAGGSACYNYYTPPNAPGDAANYYTGCVPTALAQLMRYHQYPTAGVGTAQFTITVDGVQQSRALRGGDGAGGAYQWADMPLVPASGATETQRQAIGALCHDAGVALSASYAPGSTSSSSATAATALPTTFLYANAVYGTIQDGTLPAAIQQMGNTNLDAGLPLLLSLKRPAGGHAVLCDGYGYQAATPYHHLNLGWAGTGDAWYNLPDVDTGSYVYDAVDSCVYNIYASGSGEIISGRVTDANGQPVEGAAIVGERTGGGQYTATTNARGIYALVHLPSASSYTVTAAKVDCLFTPLQVSTGRSTSYSSTTGNVWGADFEDISTAPPTGVSASDGTYEDQVRVTWDASPGATRYEVWRHTSDDSGSATRVASSVAGTAYNDTAAVPGTTYWYWVKSVRALGTSGFSSPDSGYRALPPPTGVAASDGTHTDKVAVTWDASAGATSYEVWRHTSDDSASATRLAASLTATSYDDTTATPGTLYYYWVKAASAQGTSAFSASDSGSRARPATVCVDDSNTTGQEDGSEQHPYNTIQEGIDAVGHGGTVKVAQGSYAGSLTISGKTVTIQGGYVGGTYPGTGDFTENNRDPDPATNQTVIDGAGTGAAILCQDAAARGSTLAGFRVRHRGTLFRGGVRLRRVLATSN